VFNFYGAHKFLWIIHDLPNSWEEALRRPTHEDGEAIHGGFLRVVYDYEKRPYESDDQDLDRDFSLPTYRLEQLGWTLFNFRGIRSNVKRFYEDHFVPDGILDKELALARAAAAGVEVPRPVVIPFYERANW
jgi:hypothetical protein